MHNAPRAYRAIFFDLDGTLLPMDLDAFLETYFGSLVKFVAARGQDAELFNRALMAGVKAMTSHDDDSLNAEAFWTTFFELVDENSADWQALLNEFYATKFGEIGAQVEPDRAMVRAVAALKEKGYPLVLATMPLFPPRAVQWRLAWAGLDIADFARVTHYENSTSVKPKGAYYAEILAACGLSGEDVLMVGNNTVEDVAAAQLGADVYLVTDHLLDPEGFDLSQVKHSTTEGFAAWVQALPACVNPACGIDAGVVAPAAREAVLAEAAANTGEAVSLANASAASGAAGAAGVPPAGEPAPAGFAAVPAEAN